MGKEKPSKINKILQLHPVSTPTPISPLSAPVFSFSSGLPLPRRAPAAPDRCAFLFSFPHFLSFSLSRRLGVFFRMSSLFFNFFGGGGGGFGGRSGRNGGKK